MKSFAKRAALSLSLLLLFCSPSICRKDFGYGKKSYSRPRMRRSKGGAYSTILSVDGAGVRGLLSTMIIIEVEQSIKRYLLETSPSLRQDPSVTTIDDFDINLADYFDCMTGTSSGTWAALYLASRGGQGASRAVFDDPTIIERYGRVHPGSAEGLRIMYREYSSVMFPPEAINVTAGTPLDLTNPFAPGVATPLYSLEGIEETMSLFLGGDTTLADLDTSVLIPTYDLVSAYSVFFVQNAFRHYPVTSSAILVPRNGTKSLARTHPPRFVPDLVFNEGRNYYLSDVGAAGGSVPILTPAKSITRVNNDTEEFLVIDGGVPLTNAAVPASFFVASETGSYDFQRMAILSIGSGTITQDLSPLANAGLAGWLEGLTLINLYPISRLEAQAALLDYAFYANPRTKPYQYLRIQTSAPITTEEGMALNAADQVAFLDIYESLGVAKAEEFRSSIDAFVRGFIFG